MSKDLMCYVRSAPNKAHPVVVRPCGILRESERLDAGEPQRKYPYPLAGAFGRVLHCVPRTQTVGLLIQIRAYLLLGIFLRPCQLHGAQVLT
jgi:hypothetical protein